MESHEELLEIADRLEANSKKLSDPRLARPMKLLKEAALAVGKAFSGSWLGYHANVYYCDLKAPPPGARFSQEWGLMRTVGSLGSRGEWEEFDPEEVQKFIRSNAKNPDLKPIQRIAKHANDEFERDKASVQSILSTELTESTDGFLEILKTQAEILQPLTASEIRKRLMPQGQIMTRDTTALGQGNRVPPHIAVLSEALSIEATHKITTELALIAKKAGSHILRRSRRSNFVKIVGTNVFIGHGRLTIWKDLREFVQDRVHLPWDEFNRVPVAGITNIQRLSQMLESAAIAFLVMTAEDEHDDGKTHARMNVVHEAGLFQGRLGFTRAIILLEEECEEFSNIHGLGQIRFPRGNIRAAFEEIRQVLEREGLV